MKLIIGTIQDQDADRVIENLTKQGYRVTRVATTGGFLQQGNTTLLAGVEDHQVNAVVAILKKFCHRRTQYMPMATGAAPNGMALYNYVEVEVGGASIFILDVEHFEQV
ncbi:MAG: cyclic-di-AMP receptor [Anaerolineae bacterium]|nr:cyclic-di-AMP receptor [Anaerolineae bacterium]